MRAAAPILVLALLLLPVVHAGPTQVQRYVATGDAFTAHATLGSALGDLAVNLGGAAFQGPGDERTLVVRVQDDVAGTALTLVACQDVNGSGMCDGGEPVAVGCGVVELGPASSYAPGVPVVVSVETQGALRGGCPEPAVPTSGTLAATFN